MFGAIEATNADEALLAIVLANDADTAAIAGDPLELGLLQHASAQGLDIAGTRRAHERVAGRPFDSAWKFMRSTVETDGRRRSYFKGAPEVLLQRAALSAEEHAHWKQRADVWADEGYRVLGLAASEEEYEHGLRFLGLVMLWDPPRPEVPVAIRTAQAAGVRVLMVTGDHPGTARAVARVIGMPEGDVLTGPQVESMSRNQLREAVASASVFARVTPEHKLRIVEALKSRDEVVAMTGDGVNDAPAIKRADVGVAMGQRGSDVTREVADLVLLDDNFATIVNAIEEGRSIYENIRKFMRFLFSTNVALVLLVVTGTVLAYLSGLREISGAVLLPLTAIQLLWINFAGDGPPALALSLDRNAGVMSQRPRPASSPLLDRQSLTFILSTGAIKAFAGVALLCFLPVYGFSGSAARTAVFLFEAMAQIVFVYPARRLEGSVSRNVSLDIIVAVGIAVQILMVLLPGFRAPLGLTALPVPGLAVVAIAVLATSALAEIVNQLSRPGRRPNLRR